jgi:hypothetical protein
MLTKEECKKIISKLGFKFGVSPRLIVTRLLSDEDKEDMTKGFVPIASLEKSVEVWKLYGMPNYANGETEPYEIKLFDDKYELN